MRGTSHACVTRLTAPKCVSALNVRRKQLTRRVRLKSVIALTLHISTTLLLDLVRGDPERNEMHRKLPRHYASSAS